MTVTTSQLIDDAARAKRGKPELRYGQALMNALQDLDPEAYKVISGTEADCFYDDRVVGKFYVAIAELGSD